MTHYLVQIARTSRNAGRNDDWSRYDSETHHFDSAQDACAWIKEQYDGSLRSLGPRRVPIFVDTKSRGTIQCGWIYSGTERHEEGTVYLRDWVSVARVTREAREGVQGECESVNVKTIRKERHNA